MWRLPCFRRNILPEPVTLKRLATAFRVLAFPAARAMGRGGYPPIPGIQGIFLFFGEFREVASCGSQGGGVRVAHSRGPEIATWRGGGLLKRLIRGTEQFFSDDLVLVHLEVVEGHFGAAGRGIGQAGF